MAIAYKDINWTIPGATLNVGPILTTWTDIGEFIGSTGLPLSDDTTTIDNNILLEVYNDSTNEDIFQGQKHPKYKECYCTQLTVQASNSTGPLGVASNNFRITASWAMPTYSYSGTNIGQIVRGHQLYIDQFQQYENKNFDIYGNQTIAYYKPNLSGYGFMTRINMASFFNTRPGNIRVPRTTYGMKIIQYEEIDPKSGGEIPFQAMQFEWYSKELPYLPVWNNADWGGKTGIPKACGLYLGRRVINEWNSNLCRFEYSFLVNPLGWDKQFVLATMPTGETPGVLAKNDPSDYTLGGKYGPGELGPHQPTGIGQDEKPIYGGPYPAINGVGCYRTIYEADFDSIIPNCKL